MVRLVNKIDMVLVIMVIMSLMLRSVRHTIVLYLSLSYI